MTDKKKREPPLILNMGFEEALARLMQTDPKEIADTYEQVRREVGYSGVQFGEASG